MAVDVRHSGALVEKAYPHSIGGEGAARDGFKLVGLAAMVFSGVYFVSDVIELAQGGFSTAQLVLTYVGEAAIPLFVIGLYAAQRPHIGRLGLVGAVAYAYTFVFFTGTVTFALTNHVPNWDALVDRMDPWVTVHGALMVLAGLAFGWSVVRAHVFPRWTGVALMVGVVLVAATSGLPEAAQTAASGVRAAAFAWVGASAWLALRVRRVVPAEGGSRLVEGTKR